MRSLAIKMAGNFRNNKIINKKSSLKPTTNTSSERSLTDLIRVTQLLSSDTEDTEHDYDDYGVNDNLTEVNEQLDDIYNIKDQASYTVHIKNLPNDATVQEIRKIFANYNIRSLNSTGSSAYIEIESREEVIKLLELDEPMCRGRRIFINIIDRFAGGDSSKTANENKSNEPLKTIDTYNTTATTGTTPTGTGTGTPRSTAKSKSQPEPVLKPSVTKLENEFESKYETETISAIQQSVSIESNICKTIDSQELKSTQSSLEMLSIDVKPSSIEELEKRMQFRLQKLCEFENAQTMRLEKMSLNQIESLDMDKLDSEMEDEVPQESQQVPPEPTPLMSWRDFCKQEGI